MPFMPMHLHLDASDTILRNSELELRDRARHFEHPGVVESWQHNDPWSVIVAEGITEQSELFWNALKAESFQIFQDVLNIGMW